MPRRPTGSGADSVWLRLARPPRQPAPAINHEQITRAAIELADSDGLRAVSMRRIAARIGCSPTSLYWYVSDKGELFELMVDAVIGEVELPEPPSGDWRADLAAIAWSVRATGQRHRWFGSLGIYPAAGPQTLRWGTRALRSFEGLGLGPATEVNILALLNNYIYGFLLREVAWHRVASRVKPTVTPEDARPGDGGAPPADGLSGQHLAARLNLHGNEAFAFGLERLLDGIAVLIAGNGPHAG